MNSQTIMLYVLKSVFISGIFLGYYWMALRNKNFNYYNRFYLLLSIACSVVIPCLHFNWFSIEQKDLPVAVETLDFISAQIVRTGSSAISWQDMIFYAAAGISLVLLVLFAFNIFKVYQLKRRSAIVTMNKVDVIYTDLEHAPFSFLNNLFWKESIPLDEEYGRKIFKHEITHIEQKHTLDLLFCQIINAVLWWNPFNWLIQKELKAIHEFIADKEAVGNNNAEEFVKLLLQAHYGKHFLIPTHAFYYSSIKRRLFMLTTTNKARFSHVRKLLVLPVTLLVLVTMSISTIESKATSIIAPIVPEAPITLFTPKTTTLTPAKSNKEPVTRLPKTDTTPAPAKAKEQQLKKPAAGIIYRTTDPKSDALTLPTDKVVIGGRVKDGKREIPANVLYYINGKAVSTDEAGQLKPEQIRSIHVWKGDDAVKKFGEAGASGVIEIFTKVTP
ncbi:M56 family metallopeptidase [Longitalea arenae]|uniref:M56 family metallopeptidase n=1 Tax=Longitalea arenae TaxID=2812558 RepID=UPI001967298A|nr:M56 family metallopeptidase [Longitalea arenae]